MDFQQVLSTYLRDFIGRKQTKIKHLCMGRKLFAQLESFGSTSLATHFIAFYSLLFPFLRLLLLWLLKKVNPLKMLLPKVREGVADCPQQQQILLQVASFKISCGHL
ncbi:hypothetical protein NC651_032792 [Populus alba x Populus x berolinensis]|nr:hypothetical protein NC651_032792 [Populus alba x Populus x berolinensis]